MNRFTTVVPLICLSFLASHCQDVGVFKSLNKSSQATRAESQTGPGSAATADDEPSDSDPRALDPIIISGASLVCRYQIVADSGESWCRLEQDNRPLLIRQSAPAKWTLMNGMSELKVEPQDLDLNTGWQWSMKLPANSMISADLTVFVQGNAYSYKSIISTMPIGPGPSGNEPKAPLTKSYNFAQNGSFVVDSMLADSNAPAACQTLPAGQQIPDFKQFVKANFFVFPFRVLKPSTMVSINLTEICGQSSATNYVQVINFFGQKTVPLPIGSNSLPVLDNFPLPVGDYFIQVYSSTRNGDGKTPQIFAFGKVLLQSNEDLELLNPISGFH